MPWRLSGTTPACQSSSHTGWKRAPARPRKMRWAHCPPSYAGKGKHGICIITTVHASISFVRYCSACQTQFTDLHQGPSAASATWVFNQGEGVSHATFTCMQVTQMHDIDGAMKILLDSANENFREHVTNWAAVHVDKRRCCTLCCIPADGQAKHTACAIYPWCADG